MARSYRQLTPEERQAADAIWWVQARDLDDPVFHGEGAGLYAIYDWVAFGAGLGYFCASCRTSTWKEKGEHTTPLCPCGSNRRIKLYNRAQAQHLETTPTLAERLAAE